MHAITTSEVFLLAILIIFTLPWAVWRLLRTDHYAPLVVVQIIGGILLGPGVLGAAFPDYYAFVFRPEVVAQLSGIALWGVMLFVWFAGIELDLRTAWVERRDTLTTASLALLAPLALGGLAAFALVRTGDWAGPRGADWQVVLGLGMSCAVTALPILVLFLERLQVLRHPFGQRVLRYASIDDIAVWAILAIILLDWERVARQGAFLVAFALAAMLVRRIVPRLAERDRWFFGIAWLAAAGLASDWAGLHFMVGAFLSGAVLDRRWFGEAALDNFRNALLLTVMPVFFLSTGLRTGWDAGGLAVIGAALLLLAAAIGGKLLGVHAAARLLGWPRGEASVIGWLLQTKALIMILFANVLLDRGVIAPHTFTALLLMAVLSTMLTIPVVSGRLKRLGGVG